MHLLSHRSRDVRQALLVGLVSLILALLGMTAQAAPPPAHPQAGTIDAITHLYASLDAAWNAGNAHAFAAYWTKDGVLISPMGQTSVGRARIAHDIAAELVYLKGTHHKLTIARISWPTPAVAVVDGEAVISNMMGQNGATLAPLTARFTSVCVEQPGHRWLVSYLVSYRFLPT